jgi:hypothetical protein
MRFLGGFRENGELVPGCEAQEHERTGRREAREGRARTHFSFGRPNKKYFPWEERKLTGSLRGWLFAHPKNLPAFPPSCCFLLDRQVAMNVR